MTTKALSMSDKRFDEISNLIMKTFPDSCVLWIDEVINDERMALYLAKKEEMKKLYPKEMQELQLFHGTDEKNIPFIVNEGFRTDLNKRSVYGVGNYFAEMASYSKAYMVSETSITFMFLANVLAGKKVQASKTPGPCEYFHTTGIFVIPEDDATFPTYVIAFHKNPPK